MRPRDGISPSSPPRGSRVSCGSGSRHVADPVRGFPARATPPGTAPGPASGHSAAVGRDAGMASGEPTAWRRCEAGVRADDLAVLVHPPLEGLGDVLPQGDAVLPVVPELRGQVQVADFLAAEPRRAPGLLRGGPVQGRVEVRDVAQPQVNLRLAVVLDVVERRRRSAAGGTPRSPRSSPAAPQPTSPRPRAACRRACPTCRRGAAGAGTATCRPRRGRGAAATRAGTHPRRRATSRGRPAAARPRPRTGRVRTGQRMWHGPITPPLENGASSGMSPSSAASLQMSQASGDSSRCLWVTPWSR